MGSGWGICGEIVCAFFVGTETHQGIYLAIKILGPEKVFPTICLPKILTKFG